MQSVAFASIHKCATTLFSKYVLYHVRNLEKKDYQELFYENQPQDRPAVEETGYIYGILRIHEPDHPLTESTDQLLFKLIPASMPSIVMVRDPRDIIVSMYYSFGFTHPFSKNEAINEFQKKRKRTISSMTINEYALFAREDITYRFGRLSHFLSKQQNVVILRYEDLIDNYELFYSELSRYMVLEESVREELYQKSRPRKNEDVSKHKRHGITGGFRDKLEPDIVCELNESFAHLFSQWGYQ